LPAIASPPSLPNGFSGKGCHGQRRRAGNSEDGHPDGDGNTRHAPALLAGTQTGPGLADPIRQALGLWVAEIETVFTRVMAQTPLGDLADASGLARTVSAGGFPGPRWTLTPGDRPSTDARVCYGTRVIGAGVLGPCD
jgi:hypothetical protein